MSKLLRNIGTKKQKFVIHVHITGLELKLSEPLYGVFFEFKRGSDSAQGQHKSDLNPTEGVIPIDEVFEKDSIFYLAEKKESYFKKTVQLSVKAKSEQNKKKEIMVGDVEFDCAQYVGQKKTPLVLSLKNTKYLAKLYVDLTIQEGDMLVEGESSGEESPDKSVSINGSPDFSLEAYSQKQVIDKQKVSYSHNLGANSRLGGSLQQSGQ
jgi:hypothetical protein